jgi:hypothetical protein
MARSNKRGGRGGPRISVTCYDPVAGESVSFTVYPGGHPLAEVALVLQRQAQARWSTTSLNDRRHKRR